MEKQKLQFGSLDFSASGDYFEKNQDFFEELEKDPRVLYYFEESERGTYFDLLEVNIFNAIPVPVFFEILGMKWGEEFSFREIIVLIEARGVQIVQVLDREIWDDEQRRRYEEEEAKRWTRIDCKKKCQAVHKFYHDTFSHWCATVANNHCCAGGEFWCVSKKVAEEVTRGKDISRTILTPEGDRGFWDCEIPEEAKINAHVKEVRPGDSWVCPYRLEWYAKNRVPNVVIPLPGGYAQLNDNYGLPKAVMGPDGLLTDEATVDIVVPLPENNTKGVVYSTLLGNEHGCGGYRGGRNLLERFIMRFGIGKDSCIMQEVGGQESDHFKQLAYSAGMVEYPDMEIVFRDLMTEHTGRFRKIIREEKPVLEWQNSWGNWSEDNMEQVTYTCFADLITLDLPQLFKLHTHLEKAILDSLPVALEYVPAYKPYGSWAYRNFRVKNGQWIADKYDPKETVPIGAEKDFILVSFGFGKECQESEFFKNLTQLSNEISHSCMWTDIKKSLVDGDLAYPSASLGREVLLSVPAEGKAKNFIFQINVDSTEACVCGITLKKEDGQLVFKPYEGSLRYEAYREAYRTDVIRKS